MINNIAIRQEKVTTFVSVFLNKKRLVELIFIQSVQNYLKVLANYIKLDKL